MIIYEEDNEETILESQTFRFVAENPSDGQSEYVDPVSQQQDYIGDSQDFL
jgi:hypothetical protein